MRVGSPSGLKQHNKRKGRLSPLAHHPPVLPYLFHVLVEKMLLDVVHVDLAALDVGLLDITGHIQWGSGGDKECRLLSWLQ